MYKHFSLCTDKISVDCSTMIRTVEERNEFCIEKYEILCFTAGNGKYIVEGREYSVYPKGVLVLRPLTYHCVFVPEGEEIEYISIKFDRSSIDSATFSLLEKVIGDPDVCSKYFSPIVISDSVVSVFERFELSLDIQEEIRGQYISALLSEIMIFLLSIKTESTDQPEEELGGRVVRYLNCNFEKNISLDKLARRFFVSKYYLCRAFKKHSGTSVHSYINHKRIMYAKQLIESGETASMAAYMVGFGDYSAFYRAYVKIVGKSPTGN